jgi:predicted outer membrane repeat protein
VSGNTAQGSGGGIENDGGALTLTNSTVSDNTARGGSGGGIYSLGMLMLTNTTVANNIAQSSGGGIYKAGNQAELTFCTIYGNRATRGGGIAIVMGVANNGKQTIPGFIKITNSIVAANSSAMSLDISGPIITAGYNLIQNLAGATVVLDHKHSTDLSGMTFAELLIDSSLRENRGHTQTLALLRDSPARDRIPLSACSVDGISTDQRGVQRPDDHETACDIGAYESTD